MTPVLSGGTLTALKWLAVALMIADHADWLLLDGQLGIHAGLGRLVFPLFGWIIAYNLARPGAWARRVHLRMLKRLVIVGALASPAYVYLAGWLPLNIMFSLAAFVVLAILLELRAYGAALGLLLLSGLLVDYNWLGLGYCLAVWAGYRYGRPAWILAAAAALAGLYTVNGNVFALAALPLLWLASGLRLDLPRHQLAFYAVYPVHLVGLAAIAAVL